jgi:sterol desaturase/sphingolipid hydroxylase (fatty acid hydroxylase superfamily)
MNNQHLFFWDFFELPAFLGLTGSFFLIVMLRYFLIAGGFYLFFYLIKPPGFEARKINKRPHPDGQFWYEFRYSTFTSIIFALLGSGTVLLWQSNYTAIYTDISEYGWVWIFGSIVTAMLLHESYYYWLHRWMHRPAVFKHIHKVHHNSLITSPWTAFSFHPIEGFLEGLILPAILLIVPMHPYAIVAHLTIMTLTSVINHLDIEIYPKGALNNPFGKWWIGASHHSLHHQKFTCNYGLYFTFWDKWMKTESPLFKSRFQEKTTPSPDR